MLFETPERGLLVDALGLDPQSTVTLLSREPLGAGVIAGFSVGSSQGPVTYYVDTSRRGVPRETGFVLGPREEPGVRVWLHPSDPHLPALGAVTFARAAEALLDSLGIAETGAPQIVSYRAGRRAVLRVPAEGGDIWVKSVTPGRVAAIVEAHRAVVDAGVPVPDLRGWSDDGLMVWDAAAGVPARDAHWTPEGFLDEVDALRARFATAVIDRRARTGLSRRLDWAAARLDEIVPAPLRAVAADTADRARAMWGVEQNVTTHGALHHGRLFLDATARVSAVIDVDDAGLGEPSDDTSAFVSYAITQALRDPGDDRLPELVRQAIDRWDAATLRARTAARLLSSATGAWELGRTGEATRLVEAAASVSVGDIDGLAQPSP